MGKRTVTFKVAVPITLERKNEAGQDTRYDTVAHGIFFYLLPYAGDLKGVILSNDPILKPKLQFELTLEERGLIIEALYIAAEDHLRQTS